MDGFIEFVILRDVSVCIQAVIDTEGTGWEGGGHGVVVVEDVDLNWCSVDSTICMAPGCVCEVRDGGRGGNVEESDMTLVRAYA